MARPQAPNSVTVLGECVADAFTDPARSGPGELALRPARWRPRQHRRRPRPARHPDPLPRAPLHGCLRHPLPCPPQRLRRRPDRQRERPRAHTLAVADLDETGQATYTFYADSAADWQWTDEELATAGWESTACLHTGSPALIRQPGGARIEDHLAKVREHVTVSIDPNVRPLLVPPAAYRERLPHSCALADILRLSEDDLALLLPGVSPEEACDTWHAAGARLVVITFGGRGALASLDGLRVSVSASAVDVVDTVGAGDSFTAGLLHRLATLGHLGGRLDALSLDVVTDACTFGARVAALTCSVTGANPPRVEEVALEADGERLLPSV